MVSKRATKPKNQDINLDSLSNTEEATKQPRGNRSRGKGAGNQVHGSLVNLVKEQILKQLLEDQQLTKVITISNGVGGEKLEHYSKDIGSNHEYTVKDKLLKEKPQPINGKQPKVLLRQVSEIEEY